MPREPRRLPVAVLLIGACLLGALSWTGQMADFTLFARAGTELFAGRWSEVFADRQMQAGPLVLVLSAVLDRLGGPAVLAVAGLPVVTLLAYRGAGRLRADQQLGPRAAVQFAAASALLLWEAGEGGIHSGHLSQLVVPALWLAAGATARRGRVVTAGALLAAAVGCETWGVLALPVLLLADGLRRQAVAAGSALAGVLALYLPFMLTGRFAMFEFHWFMSTETVYGQLAPYLFDQLSASGFPWWARCFQAAMAMTCCTAVVLRRPGDAATTWTAPLAAVLARLVLDPVGMNYYWTAAVVLLIAGAATAPPARAVVAVLACWWQFFPVAQLWSGTLLVTVPMLILVLRLPSNRSVSLSRSPSAAPSRSPASAPAVRAARSSA